MTYRILLMGNTVEMAGGKPCVYGLKYTFYLAKEFLKGKLPIEN